MKFKKKPVVIDAIQWNGGSFEILEDFCGMNWGRADAKMVEWSAPPDGEKVVLWNTKERQWLLCPVGHWVIRGVAGELYPCAPDVFRETYEAVP